MNKWKSAKVRMASDKDQSVVIIWWPDGKFQRASLNSRGPRNTLIDLFAPVCHSPDQYTNIGILFTCGLNQLGVTLAECFEQHPTRTVEFLDAFLGRIYDRVKENNGTREGEMEDLVHLLELAKEYRSTTRLVKFFGQWIEVLGEFPVRGPRNGVLRKRWLRKKKA